MAQQIKITQTSNADMNIGVTKKITAVEWLYERVSDLQGTNPYLDMEFEQAKQMENETRKEDFKIGYNQGYLDAKLNHINDADNSAYEHDYLTNND